MTLVAEQHGVLSSTASTIPQCGTKAATVPLVACLLTDPDNKLTVRIIIFVYRSSTLRHLAGILHNVVELVPDFSQLLHASTTSLLSKMPRPSLKMLVFSSFIIVFPSPNV
jgi:hypothetical protein